jgi:hypothetical protein
MSSVVEGGCACGSIRYRGENRPDHETYCHCTICRKVSGAPVVAWITFPEGNFRFTRGQPERYDSSDWAYREFCSRCGTQLTFHDKRDPGRVDVTTSSLDDPGTFPPKDHIWVRSRIPWFEVADALPRYETRRGKA